MVCQIQFPIFFTTNVTFSFFCAGCFTERNILSEGVLICYGDCFAVFNNNIARNALGITGVTLVLAGGSNNGILIKIGVDVSGCRNFRLAVKLFAGRTLNDPQTFFGAGGFI